MSKIPAQKYPEKVILRESVGAARVYEIKNSAKSEKKRYIFVEIVT